MFQFIVNCLHLNIISYPLLSINYLLSNQLGTINNGTSL